MLKSSSLQNISTYWLTPFFTITALILIVFKIPFPIGMLWSGLLLPERMYGHSEPTAETASLFIIYLIMKYVGYTDLIILFFPLMVTLLLWASWKTTSKWMQFLFSISLLSWMTMAGIHLYHTPGILGWCLWSSSWIAVGIHSTLLIQQTDKPIKALDIILCSFSGHTADFTNLFMKEIKNTRTTCTTHRFHYAHQFQPNLNGDGLALAFPVSGWKPPWTVIAYLLKKIPYGGGKPAFILYTSMGGPDNAGIVAWLLLTLKGYRVQGSQWAFYPNNVPTLRLGFNGFWKWLDRIVPLKKTCENITQSGLNFIQGQRCGHPLIMWPTPFSLLGLLVDNRWFNIVFYRNYIWRWRCIQCGLCIRHCPTQRLTMHKGYPKAKGTCALCMGCVNLCPKRAMQMLIWTEYGHAYHSRWPQLIVKSTSDKLLKKEKTQ